MEGIIADIKDLSNSKLDLYITKSLLDKMTKNRGISITSTYHSTHIWCFTWTDFWTIRKSWISNASTPCLPPARCKISHHNHSTLSLWTLLYTIQLRWFQFLTWAYGGTWPLRNPGKFAFLLASFSQSDLVTNFREAVCRSKEQKAEPALNLAITHCYDFIRARHARKSRDPQTSNTEVCQNVTSSVVVVVVVRQVTLIVTILIVVDVCTISNIIGPAGPLSRTVVVPS